MFHIAGHVKLKRDDSATVKQMACLAAKVKPLRQWTQHCCHFPRSCGGCFCLLNLGSMLRAAEFSCHKPVEHQVLHYDSALLRFDFVKLRRSPFAASRPLHQNPKFGYIIAPRLALRAIPAWSHAEQADEDHASQLSFFSLTSYKSVIGPIAMLEILACGTRRRKGRSGPVVAGFNVYVCMATLLPHNPSLPIHVCHAEDKIGGSNDPFMSQWENDEHHGDLQRLSCMVVQRLGIQRQMEFESS
eukprot:s3425_g6.t1